MPHPADLVAFVVKGDESVPCSREFQLLPGKVVRIHERHGVVHRIEADTHERVAELERLIGGIRG